MKKISETNVIDIVPFKSGFIYVKKYPRTTALSGLNFWVMIQKEWKTRLLQKAFIS